MTFWKSPAFKALQAEWYQRLEAEGFKDAEEFDGEEVRLKDYSLGRKREIIMRLQRQRYFAVISEYVQQTQFESIVDEIILTWYADGRKIKHICEELKRQGQSRCRETIRFTIRRYEMQWGIKQYSPKQLRLTQRAG